MSVFWSSLLWFVLGGAVGALISFVLTRKKFEKELKENPPVNEKMIRAMFMQMGRKPSEAQIKAVMRSMNQAK
ncbi:MAG: YneF family protein [Bulleidia sp.]|nr:YneF family protein [Bulleidia sp.]